MSHSAPRIYKYTQNNAILTVGIDAYGRVFSSVEKNGRVLAQDMFVKIPSEVTLAKQGWIRYYE